MNEFDKVLRKTISDASVLKLVPREPITLRLPRPIAANLQFAAEWSNWNSAALAGALTGFVTGTAASRNVQAGAVAALGKGVVSMTTYAYENAEDAYSRVREAWNTGETNIKLPLSDVLAAIDKGKLVDLAFEMAEDKIKAYSPKGSIRDTEGGLLLVQKLENERYHERQNK